MGLPAQGRGRGVRARGASHGVEALERQGAGRDERARLANLPRGFQHHDQGRAASSAHALVGGEHDAGAGEARHTKGGIRQALADPDGVHSDRPVEARRHRHRGDGFRKNVRLCRAHARVHSGAAAHDGRGGGVGALRPGHGPDPRARAADRGGDGQVCAVYELQGGVCRGRAEHRGAGVQASARVRDCHRDSRAHHRRLRAAVHRASAVQLHRAGRGGPDDRHGLRAAGHIRHGLHVG